MSKISLGKKGEELAEKYLLDRRYKILDKNFHSRFGEIDLIATHKDTLVFIEVKTRYSDKFGRPEEAVTPAKIRTIARVGQYYKNIREHLPEAERIDVVAIDLEGNGNLKRIELIENVTG